MLQTFTLKNGIKVATYNLPQLKSVHLRQIVKGGVVVEEKDKEGAAHFMEHILCQGIPSLPTVEQFASYIEGLAGSYNAYTEDLSVGFFITVPSTHLEDALRIGKEVFFEPLFNIDDIERERRAILQELEQKMDSHWYKISKFFRDSRFKKGHPLTFDSAVTKEVIKKLTREDLTNYWHKYFLPKNTYLSVTGNFLDSDLNRLLNQYFGEIKFIKSLSFFPKMNNQDLSKRQVVIRKDNTLQSIYLDLTFPSLGMLDKRDLRRMQNLCFVIFGKLHSSRLYKLLRFQKGLVYSVEAGFSTFPGLGYGFVTSQVSPENLEEVVRLIAAELFAFVKNGPTQEELDFAKHFVSNQWLMAFDHPSSIAGWISGDLMWEDKISLPEESIEAIKKFKVEELIELMQKYWDFGKLNLVVQGPIENSKNNIKKYSQMLEVLK